MNSKYDICMKIWEENTNKKIKTLILFTLFFALVVFLLYRLKYNLFITMALLFSIFSIIFFYIFPIGVEPDARNHFLRAYEISEGTFITPKNNVEKLGVDSLPKALEGYSNSKSNINENDLKEYSFANTAVYSPISYLPQSIGIKFAKMFTNNTQSIFYFARGLTSIINVLLCLLAIYLIPYHKNFCFVVLMFPMTLELLTSISPDGWTISLVFLYISLVFHIISKSYINKNQIIGLFLISWLIALNKIVYLPLLFLIFLIPASCFKNERNSRYIKSISVITSCLLNLIWLNIAKSYLAGGLPAGVNSQMQLQFIIFHPFQYLNTICLTFLLNFEMYVGEMIGKSLGALNIPVNSLVWVGFLILVVFLIIIEKRNPLSNLNNLLISSGLIAVVVILIATSLYIQWTPYQASIIEGIQGRYFIPLLPLLLLVLNKKFNSQCINQKISYRVVFMSILFLDSIAVLDIMHHFL